MSELKRCSKCKQEKETTQFYVSRKSKDGLGNECKECKRERSKTVEFRNAPSNRKAWADKTLSGLRLTDSDY